MSRLIHRSFVRHNKIISVNIFWTTYRSTRTIICERPLTIFASLVCKNFESSQTFPSSAWHQRSKSAAGPTRPSIWNQIETSDQGGTDQRCVHAVMRPLCGQEESAPVGISCTRNSHAWELSPWTHRRPLSTCTECALWELLRSSKLN